MIVLGGGVPRNTVQSASLASKKGLDYAVVVTMDRPETGGLSGSTLKETISWGKVKGEADNVMVIGDIMMVFPLMAASVMETARLKYNRSPVMKQPGGAQNEKRQPKKSISAATATATTATITPPKCSAARGMLKAKTPSWTHSGAAMTTTE